MKRTKAAQVSPDADGKSGERFNALLGRIIRVPKDELNKREIAYQESRSTKKTRTEK